MTGSQSRSLDVGARVYWRDDKNDQATVTEKNWAGVTLKWDNRSHRRCCTMTWPASASCPGNDRHETFENRRTIH
jgi:hypothetical protein